jgi:hypothetical protein
MLYRAVENLWRTAGWLGKDPLFNSADRWRVSTSAMEMSFRHFSSVIVLSG